MRFLADMGVAGRVVEWLRESGHEVVHLRDEGLKRSPDQNIFLKAVNEERIILTFDLDFGEIVALSGSDKVSVILFRLFDATATHVIQRLSVVLPACSEDLVQGAVVVVEEHRYRIRKLPIGQ